MQTLTVGLGERSYPIHIGSGLLDQAALLLPAVPRKRAAIVSNTTVAPLYMGRLRLTLQSFGISSEEIILPDGEAFKNFETLNLIYDALLGKRCERSTPLIALGGGVVGDLTGYAAATYLRGVPFIQIPTTLLAQVDSSVGGKTGINHPLGKNMMGAFYQPQLVLADIDTLNTLPDKELAAGLAEVIKYGLIRDLPFLAWLEQNIDKLMARDTAALQYAIARSCQNKAEVVAADESESGERALLNLGHTFGHAIESGMGYGNWLHGESVAAGTVMAADLSQRSGLDQCAGCGAHPQAVRASRVAGGRTRPGCGPVSGIDGAGQEGRGRQDALRAAQADRPCFRLWGRSAGNIAANPASLLQSGGR